MTSYEVWDSFVRVNVTFIDQPLRSGREDALVLRLSDGTFAKMVHGNGGGSDRSALWERRSPARSSPRLRRSGSDGTRADPQCLALSRIREAWCCLLAILPRIWFSHRSWTSRSRSGSGGGTHHPFPLSKMGERWLLASLAVSVGWA